MHHSNNSSSQGAKSSTKSPSTRKHSQNKRTSTKKRTQRAIQSSISPHNPLPTLSQPSTASLPSTQHISYHIDLHPITSPHISHRSISTPIPQFTSSIPASLPPFHQRTLALALKSTFHKRQQFQHPFQLRSNSFSTSSSASQYDHYGSYGSYSTPDYPNSDISQHGVPSQHFDSIPTFPTSDHHFSHSYNEQQYDQSYHAHSSKPDKPRQKTTLVKDVDYIVEDDAVARNIPDQLNEFFVQMNDLPVMTSWAQMLDESSQSSPHTKQSLHTLDAMSNEAEQDFVSSMKSSLTDPVLDLENDHKSHPKKLQITQFKEGSIKASMEEFTHQKNLSIQHSDPNSPLYSSGPQNEFIVNSNIVYTELEHAITALHSYFSKLSNGDVYMDLDDSPFAYYYTTMFSSDSTDPSLQTPISPQKQSNASNSPSQAYTQARSHHLRMNPPPHIKLSSSKPVLPETIAKLAPLVPIHTFQHIFACLNDLPISELRFAQALSLDLMISNPNISNSVICKHIFEFHNTPSNLAKFDSSLRNIPSNLGLREITTMLAHKAFAKQRFGLVVALSNASLYHNLTPTISSLLPTLKSADLYGTTLLSSPLLAQPALYDIASPFEHTSARSSKRSASLLRKLTSTALPSTIAAPTLITPIKITSNSEFYQFFLSHDSTLQSYTLSLHAISSYFTSPALIRKLPSSYEGLPSNLEEIVQYGYKLISLLLNPQIHKQNPLLFYQNIPTILHFLLVCQDYSKFQHLVSYLQDYIGDDCQQYANMLDESTNEQTAKRQQFMDLGSQSGLFDRSEIHPAHNPLHPANPTFLTHIPGLDGNGKFTPHTTKKKSSNQALIDGESGDEIPSEYSDGFDVDVDVDADQSSREDGENEDGIDFETKLVQETDSLSLFHQVYRSGSDSLRSNGYSRLKSRVFTKTVQNVIEMIFAHHLTKRDYAAGFYFLQWVQSVDFLKNITPHYFNRLYADSDDQTFISFVGHKMISASTSIEKRPLSFHVHSFYSSLFTAMGIPCTLSSLSTLFDSNDNKVLSKTANSVEQSLEERTQTLRMSGLRLQKPLFSYLKQLLKQASSQHQTNLIQHLTEQPDETFSTQVDSTSLETAITYDQLNPNVIKLDPVTKQRSIPFPRLLTPQDIIAFHRVAHKIQHQAIKIRQKIESAFPSFHNIGHYHSTSHPYLTINGQDTYLTQDVDLAEIDALEEKKGELQRNPTGHEDALVQIDQDIQYLSQKAHYNQFLSQNFKELWVKHLTPAMFQLLNHSEIELLYKYTLCEPFLQSSAIDTAPVAYRVLQKKGYLGYDDDGRDIESTTSKLPPHLVQQLSPEDQDIHNLLQDSYEKLHALINNSDLFTTEQVAEQYSTGTMRDPAVLRRQSSPVTLSQSIFTQYPSATAIGQNMHGKPVQLTPTPYTDDNLDEIPTNDLVSLHNEKGEAIPIKLQAGQSARVLTKVNEDNVSKSMPFLQNSTLFTTSPDILPNIMVLSTEYLIKHILYDDILRSAKVMKKSGKTVPSQFSSRLNELFNAVMEIQSRLHHSPLKFVPFDQHPVKAAMEEIGIFSNRQTDTIFNSRTKTRPLEISTDAQLRQHNDAFDEVHRGLKKHPSSFTIAATTPSVNLLGTAYDITASPTDSELAQFEEIYELAQFEPQRDNLWRSQIPIFQRITSLFNFTYKVGTLPDRTVYNMLLQQGYTSSSPHFVTKLLNHQQLSGITHLSPQSQILSIVSLLECGNIEVARNLAAQLDLKTLHGPSLITLSRLATSFNDIHISTYFLRKISHNIAQFEAGEIDADQVYPAATSYYVLLRVLYYTLNVLVPPQKSEYGRVYRYLSRFKATPGHNFTPPSDIKPLSTYLRSLGTIKYQPNGTIELSPTHHAELSTIRRKNRVNPMLNMNATTYLTSHDPFHFLSTNAPLDGDFDEFNNWTGLNAPASTNTETNDSDPAQTTTTTTTSAPTTPVDRYRLALELALELQTNTSFFTLISTAAEQSSSSSRKNVDYLLNTDNVTPRDVSLTLLSLITAAQSAKQPQMEDYFRDIIAFNDPFFDQTLRKKSFEAHSTLSNSQPAAVAQATGSQTKKSSLRSSHDQSRVLNQAQTTARTQRSLGKKVGVKLSAFDSF